MEHLDTFLIRYPPFDGLGPDELRELTADAEEHCLRGRARTCSSRTGCPAAGLWVILTGSMDLVHEGEPIQVLEPGECFGHPRC